MIHDRTAYTRFPRLNGLLVNLRELSIHDATDITHLMTYNVSRSLWNVPHPYTVENALNLIKSSHTDFQSLKAVNFAIEYKRDSEADTGLVGIISLKNIDYVNKKANLGYWIGERYWSKGIATECVRLVVLYAFSELKLREVSAYVYPQNIASIRVLEKNGMRKKEEVNEYNQATDKSLNSFIYVVQNNLK